MNKIKVLTRRETNFVYHMLSVARCGYDNAYGAKYADRHPAEALKALKKHEQLITVRGGEHCGALYGLMVGCPSLGTGSAKEFYLELVREVDENEVPEWGKPYAEPVREMSLAMAQCYDRYVNDIWPDDEKRIKAYRNELMPLFENSSFTGRAEQAVGCALPSESFCAALVASVEGGAQAIDLSEDVVVFGIDRKPEDSFSFIGHEFIICLLRQALRACDAFCRFETYWLTEGLADYYLRRLTGSACFTGSGKYVAFYEARAAGRTLTAPELYREALAAQIV